MSNIAIITARGGSKRIPRKNIKDFLGKPIIAYSIEAAVQSNLFDEVMVSTDDAEIVEVAKKYGAVVPFMRSDKTANDFATTEDVLEEVIDQYRAQNIDFDWFACIYPTAPLVSIKRLQEGYQIFQDSQADALESVVAFSYPPQRCYRLSSDKLEYRWPQFIKARSQDLEKYYHDAGQFYFFRTQPFLKMRQGIQTMDKVPLILGEDEVQDIDNISDWAIAELKYKMMLRRQRRGKL